MTKAFVERRRLPRTRTRLRPGKLLDADGAFLADCAILDRSADGARIRVFGDEAETPAFLFDERGGAKHPATAAWARRGEAGLRLSAPVPVDAAERQRIAGPYYALAD